jgi:hypothetical protein
MGHLVDEAQVEARFGPFGDRATLDARFASNVPWAQKIVLEAPDGTPS